jgi:hypothetical protein
VKLCERCNTNFSPKVSYQIYCGTKCRDDATKEKITERRKIKITCECGSEIRKRNLLDHLKTTKHMQFLNEKHLSNLSI